MEFLSYSPETGEFRWKKRPANRVKVGDLAGSVTGQGYREIELRGIIYRCNRLAWLFMTGEWPSGEVDHANTIEGDDRFENLRDATKAQNQHNRRRNWRGTSRYKGVHFHKLTGKWGASIQVNGERRHLGLFDLEEDAAQVRILESVALHGAFARAG
jgi:hypothetical protein